MNIGFNADFSSISRVPLIAWLLIAVILFTQAFWLFTDASKRGANKWLWGIWGLIQAPSPLLLYLLIVRKILSHNKKEKRLKRILIALWIILSIILIAVGIIFHN
jgi:hypothetical protein